MLFIYTLRKLYLLDVKGFDRPAIGAIKLKRRIKNESHLSRFSRENRNRTFVF